MKKFLNELKNHLMTGVSLMIPLVVGGGLCYALSILFGGPTVGSQEGTFWNAVNGIGSYGLGLIVPLVCVGVAYSIADKPGIAPAIIVGSLANDIGSGFLGGLLGGIMVGYFANWLKEKLLKVCPKSIKPLIPIMLIPFITTFVCGVLMKYVVGVPIVAIMNALTNLLLNLQEGGKFLFGAAIGGLAGTDFGGAINKSVVVFTFGLMDKGIYEPLASLLLGCMIPPIGIVLSYLMTPKKYTDEEKEAVKACVPMGICMITECVIPFAINDLWRVVLSSVVGCAVAGGMSMVMGIQSFTVHGGWFIIPLMSKPLQYVICMVVGSVIMAVMLSLLKKTKKTKKEETKVAE